jgi:tungstate transport system permease protein
MSFFEPFNIALQLLFSFDAELYDVIFLSLQVSSTAVFSALLFGIPIGAVLAIKRFFGRSALLVISKTMLGMPPVVIGLLVYVLISRSGPLGFLDILYTPQAMMLAQFILILPLSIALSHQIFEKLDSELNLFFMSLGLGALKRVLTLLSEARYELITISMVCFGRAISEIGAVILVGGNIKYLTRVMTSSIALETSKGNIAFALALGIVLMLIALLINLFSHMLSQSVLKEATNG